MPRVKCKTVTEGLIPRQRSVEIQDATGFIEDLLVLDSCLEHGDELKVLVKGRVDGDVLVEYPAETSSGHWCSWVREEQMVDL